MPIPVVPKSALDIRPLGRPRMNKYLNVRETEILIALMRSVGPKIVIEIGCNVGITARAILETIPDIERYIGIDVPWDHKPTLDCQRTEVPYTAGNYATGDDRFWLMVLNSGSLHLSASDLEPCDAVFIDGDHSATAVRHDSELARALVRAGGLIVWHDFGNASVEVTDVLENLYDEGWPIQAVEGSWMAFMRV